MNFDFECNQTEEFYRKLLLLDKVKPQLGYSEKYYIFHHGHCWDILLKDSLAPKLCFKYARLKLAGRFPEGEKYIAMDGNQSYNYASIILQGPFPLGEKAISQDPYMSYSYVIDVLKGPFPLGEKAIATSHIFSYRYAKEILKDRFPLAEPSILNSIYKNDYLEFLEEIG